MKINKLHFGAIISLIVGFAAIAIMLHSVGCAC